MFEDLMLQQRTSRTFEFCPVSPVTKHRSNKHEENLYHPYEGLETLRQRIGHLLCIAKCKLVGPAEFPANSVLDTGKGTGVWAVDATAVLPI